MSSAFDDDDEQDEMVYSGSDSLILNQDAATFERTFKCTLRNIQLKNTKDLTRPKVKFTLGGNYHEEDRRHAGEGIVKTGKKGPEFTTESIKGYDDKDGATFDTEFVKYWQGTYEDLKDQELLIQVFNVGCCGCSKELMGEARLNLHKWADGTIAQEHELRLRQGGRNVIAGDIQFMGYFQEVWDFKLSFTDWKGRNLLAKDSSGTSDPYIKIKFDNNWSQMFQGGLNRSCQSEHCIKTLQPTWSEVGEITYRGTRSELENEIIKIECFDWDQVGKDDLIGSADVLMRGVLDYGSMDLEIRETKKVTRNGETLIEVTPAGGLEGMVTSDTLPRFEQEGDIVIPVPGMRYLAVKINSASNLRATDDNGSTDCFFTITWGGVTQTTKIVKRNLNPKFDETLYFPVRLVSDTPDALAKKGPVKVYAWDWDEAGNDQQGQFDIDLYDILNGATDQYDPKNNKSNTRMYKNAAQQLFTANADEPSEATVDFAAWFQPDFPSSMVLEKDMTSQLRELPPVYKEREVTWREGIPAALLKDGEYFIEAGDESGALRFLPTFIQPINPPKDLQGNTLKVARTVQCFTFSSDVDAFQGMDDVWCSTNYFLDMKKGDAEEHAMLMCNLFLGLTVKEVEGKPPTKINAFCANGKTKNGEDHTWVVTLENDGSVIFWETTNGKRYVLPERWLGDEEHQRYALMGDDDDSDEEEEEVDMGDVAVDVSADNKGKGKITADMLRDDEDVVLDRQDIQRENAAYEAEEVEVFEVDDGPQMSLPKGSEKLVKVNVPYMSIETLFNAENIWANIQHSDPTKIKYDINDPLQWRPFVDPQEDFVEEHKCFFTPRNLGPSLRGGRLEALEQAIYHEVCAGVTNWRHGEHMETEIMHEMAPVLKEGMELMENQKVSFDPEEFVNDISSWKGKVSMACPPSHKFRGVPICFFFTDAKRIRKEMMTRYDFHQETNSNAKFAFGVHVAAYPGAVAAVWIYFSVMTPVS